MIKAFDYLRGYNRIEAEVEAAIRRVLRSGQLILGPEVSAFEREFAQSNEAQHAIGVGCGTDALVLALRSLGIGPSDEVVTVANTAVATVAAIRATGAQVRLVDVGSTDLLIDPTLLEAAITPQTRAIVPVHLFGQAADMDTILDVAQRHNLAVVEDCAQAHGTLYKGRHVGTLGAIGCFSFYPTKNLGALGDGGACTTDDPELAQRLRSLRVYGFDDDRVSQMEGLCSRLDELQAAVLRVKLPHLQNNLQARRRIAQRYRQGLASTQYGLLQERQYGQHAYHLFVIRSSQREKVLNRLAKEQVGYGIHYPVPIHKMPAYRSLACGSQTLPVTEQAANEILSLPMYPELRDDEVDRVIQVLRDALR